MLQIFYRIRKFLDNEIRYKRLLLVLAALYFFMLGLTGDLEVGTLLVRESYFHFAESAAAVIFFVLLFVPVFRERVLLLTNSYIYFINGVNLWLLYAGHFYDAYCYEFTLIYLMSNFYLRKRGVQLGFNVVMAIGIVLVAVAAPKDLNSNLSKYAIIFLVVNAGMYLMVAYRYILLGRLAESEARYKLLAQNADDMIGLHDFDGRILFISPSVKKLLGYEVSECINKHPIGFVHPDDTAQFAKFSIDYLLEQQHYDVVAYRLRKKDGSYLKVESVFRLINDGTETQQVMSATRDVSFRAKAAV